jgi:hypothetical protein
MNEERQSATTGDDDSMSGPCARFGAELDSLLRALAPSEEVRRHFRNARIEVLKGLRSLLDERIHRLSSEREKGTSLTIE